MIFHSEIEQKAHDDYVIMVYAECVPDKTAEILLKEKYGETIAAKVIEEVRGWE